MRTIYVDSAFRCHVSDDGTRTAVNTTFFDGKCDAFVEGYCYDTGSGYTYIYPWEDFSALDAAQRTYELEKIEQYEALINELYEEVL